MAGSGQVEAGVVLPGAGAQSPSYLAGSDLIPQDTSASKLATRTLASNQHSRQKRKAEPQEYYSFPEETSSSCCFYIIV